MTKARTIDRLKLTAKKFGWLKDMDKVPAAPGAEETNAELLKDREHCPICGAELRHVGGCLECPNKDWSACG